MATEADPAHVVEGKLISHLIESLYGGAFSALPSGVTLSGDDDDSEDVVVAYEGVDYVVDVHVTASRA